MVTSQRLVEEMKNLVLLSNSAIKNTWQLIAVDFILLCWLYVWFFVLQVEDLIKVEGMTEKRFATFMKVSPQ